MKNKFTEVDNCKEFFVDWIFWRVTKKDIFLACSDLSYIDKWYKGSTEAMTTNFWVIIINGDDISTDL